MAPNYNCGQCDSIWRSYSAATAEHLKLLLDRDMATARHDQPAEDELNSRILPAEQRRTACREVLRQHESQAH